MLELCATVKTGFMTDTDISQFHCLPDKLLDENGFLSDHIGQNEICILTTLKETDRLVNKLPGVHRPIYVGSPTWN